MKRWRALEWLVRIGFGIAAVSVSPDGPTWRIYLALLLAMFGVSFGDLVQRRKP